MMKHISKYISLKEYIPTGNPDLSNFELKEEEIKIDQINNVLVKNEWISVDPYMRARMTEKKNYKPPFQLNMPLEGAAVGKVIESKSNFFSTGDFVKSDNGWRDSFITSDKNLKKIDPINVPIQTYLGPLGMTGHTAFIDYSK